MKFIKKKKIFFFLCVFSLLLLSIGYSILSTSLRISEDVTISKIKWELTFNPNGGITSLINKEVYMGKPYGELPIATLSGYYFEGWFTDLEAGEKIEKESTFLYGNNQTLFAHYSIKNMMLDFDANGGEIDASPLEVTYGLVYPSLPVPTRSGYTFNGWYTMNNGGSPINQSVLVSKVIDHTAFAHWNANQYTLRYEKGAATGGVLPEEQSVTFDSQLFLATNNLSKANTNLGTVTFNYNGSGQENTTSTAYTTYAPNGWLDSDGTHYTNGQDIFYTKASDFVLRADFTANNHSAVFPTPTRTGYTFEGWYTAASGGSKVTSYTGTSNVTYYAHWVPKQYTVTYNYSYNGGSSSTKTSANVAFGSAIDLSPRATKSSYEFIGWNTNQNATTGLSSLSMPSNNVTLYAIYKKTFTITYIDYNGTNKSTRNQSVSVYNKDSSTTIKTLSLQNYTGWSQVGWNADSNQKNGSVGNWTVDKDMTLYAVYSKTITVTLKSYNNVTSTKTGVAYFNSSGKIFNAEIQLPNSGGFSNEWSFRGWSTSSSATASINIAANGVALLSANTTYYASASKLVNLRIDNSVIGKNIQTITKTAYAAYNSLNSATFNPNEITKYSYSGHQLQGFSTSKWFPDTFDVVYDSAYNATFTLGSDLTIYPVFYSEKQRFLNDIYLIAHKRQMANVEFKYWVAFLDSYSKEEGMKKVMWGVASSQEIMNRLGDTPTAHIKACYSAVLGRAVEPTIEEINFHLSHYISLQAAFEEMFITTESQAWRNSYSW